MNLKHQSNEAHMLCPNCNFEYTHLIKITPTKIDERLAVVLEFQCENDCMFSYTVYNHEGYTFVSLNKQ